jgi:hypothetical protein
MKFHIFLAQILHFQTKMKCYMYFSSNFIFSGPKTKVPTDKNVIVTPAPLIFSFKHTKNQYILKLLNQSKKTHVRRCFLLLQQTRLNQVPECKQPKSTKVGCYLIFFWHIPVFFVSKKVHTKCIKSKNTEI